MLVLVLLAATLVACAKPTASQEQADTTQTQTEQTGDVKPGAGAKKLGIILSGTKDDYGFNLNFVQLGELVEKELGIEVVIKENVPTTSDSEGVMEEPDCTGVHHSVPLAVWIPRIFTQCGTASS